MNRLRQIGRDKKQYFSSDYDFWPDYVFWTCFVLLLIIDCVENTSVIYSEPFWPKGRYLFRNCLYLILLMKSAFMSTYRRKELLAVGAIYLIVFASVLGSGDMALFKFAVVAIAAKDESPRKIVKAFAWVKGCSIIITLFLWKIGLLSAVYYQDDKVGYYNTYGFCHRNVLGANVAVVCLAWFYLRYRKIKVQDAVVWLGISLLTYKLAVSRTSLIIMIFIIISMYLVQWKEQEIIHIPNVKKILLGGFLGMIAVCILCTVFYSKDVKIWDIIDKVFTKRIRLANSCFEEYGFSLFGQHIPFVSSIQAQHEDVKKLILDNAYMRALLYYGAIPGTLFLTAYYRAMHWSCKKEDCALLVSLIAFAVYGLSERYMLDVFYQFPLLIAYVKYFFKPEHRSVNDRQYPLEFANDIIRHFVRKKR